MCVLPDGFWEVFVVIDGAWTEFDEVEWQLVVVGLHLLLDAQVVVGLSVGGEGAEYLTDLTSVGVTVAEVAR
jgi:hypothetical protein